MTFAELRQALYDRLGTTTEETMVDRLLNNAKDLLAQAGEWEWLETSVAVVFTTSQNTATLGSSVGKVLEVDNASGVPLKKCDRRTYQTLYRGDASTAAAPTAWALDGTKTSREQRLIVWPTPSALSTGTLRFLTRPADMTLGTEVPEHIPASLHPFIITLAVAEARELKGHPSAPSLRSEANRYLAELEHGRPQEVIRSDG